MPSINRRAFMASSALLAGTAGWRATGAAEPVVAAANDSQLGNTPHTRFAVNIEMWWSKLPFLERIKQAAALGFPAVEFWPWQGKDLAAIAELTGRLGVAVAQFTAWGFRPGMNNPDNHAAFVDAVGQGCQAAKQLNCKLMTVVGGDDQPGMTQAQMHEHIITALEKAAPVAAEHDVMLILEPMNIRVDHKGHCLYGSKDAVRICREVDSPHVKINWDLYHMRAFRFGTPFAHAA